MASLLSPTLFTRLQETEPLGSINLLLGSVKTSLEGSTFFDIVTPERVYHFQARSRREMTRWLDEIRIASERVYNDLPTSTPTSASGEGEKERSRVSTLTQAQSEENLQRIKAFMGNTPVCADCNTPNPEWASISLGIFLCIDCAGVHRSLGAHISKVRSISLDRWEKESVEVRYRSPLPSPERRRLIKFDDGRELVYGNYGERQEQCCLRAHDAGQCQTEA